MKCSHCNKIIRKNWFYCPSCGELLRKKRITKSDNMCCSNCGYARARHKGLLERLDACDEFRKL